MPFSSAAGSSGARGTWLPTRNGTTKWKVLPVPSVLSTSISPPILDTMPEAIESPSPVPPKRRLVLPSAWWKDSKM